MRIAMLVMLVMLLMGCGGLEPSVREDFEQLKKSQRIVGQAYLRDLQAANDKALRTRTLQKVAEGKKLKEVLEQNAQLQALHRAAYGRIRDVMYAMHEYAVGFEILLSKLERRKKAEDDLKATGKTLFKAVVEGMKKGAGK